MTQTIKQSSQSKTTLAQHVDAHGRNAAAKALGRTPAALTKAFKGGIIFVEQAGGGKPRAVELREFPGR